MTKLIVLCMNEIPIGVYGDREKAIDARNEHNRKEGGLFQYQYELREFEVDAAAKR